jgi:hypothetical protein
MWVDPFVNTIVRHATPVRAAPWSAWTSKARSSATCAAKTAKTGDGRDVPPDPTPPVNRANLFQSRRPNNIHPAFSTTSALHPQNPPNSPATLKSKRRRSLAGSAAFGVPCGAGGKDRVHACRSVRKLASFCNFVRGPKRFHSAIAPAPIRPRARRRARIGFVSQFLPKTNLASFCNHAHADLAAGAPRRRDWLRFGKSRAERIPRLALPTGPVFPEDGADLLPDCSKPTTQPALKPSLALTAPNRKAAAPCTAAPLSAKTPGP